MAVETVKSAPITALDTVPVVTPTAGEGAPGYLRENSGSAVMSAAASINSVYKYVRIPTNAKVKHVLFETAAQAAGATDIGLYYSSSPVDGTPPSLQGLVVDQDFFATAVAISSAVAITDVTNESGTYTIEKRLQPIWQAAGLAADPGGYFDVCATLTTAVTTGTGRAGVSVEYTDG